MSSVDVVVPCYNYAHYLDECVNSVLGQEGVSVRVLVIDDCSSDRTAEVGRRLAGRDPRVSFRRHEVNRGHLATYNEGLLEWASGDYSLLLSADDLLTPGALARAASIMDRHPEVGMTYGFVVCLFDDERPTLSHVVESDDYCIVPGSQFLQYYCETASNPVQTATAVVRTSVQKAIGGYRADLPHSGDMEMWMRFAVHGSIGASRATQGFYRQHVRNMSLSYYRGSLVGDRRERLRAFTALFADWGSRIANAAELREMSRRSLGEEAFWTASRALDCGNARGFRECLAFAEEVYPEIRRAPAWKKLRVKALLGARAWRRVRPIVDRVRGTSGAAARDPWDPAQVVPSRVIGWWPAS